MTALPLTDMEFSASLPLIVLAPHPDDFDAIAVTLRYFAERGHPLSLLVATSGASGVEDSFCSPACWEKKTALREEEQRASCRLFGLDSDQVTFLRLSEDPSGHFKAGDSDKERLRQIMMESKPGLLFLPHGNDTNLCHQRMAHLIQQMAGEFEFPLAVFFNEDPKTISMRCDTYLPFGEEEAAWKAKLLRCHQSQQQRNLKHRGYGLDERILRVNRDRARALALTEPYAEVFEIIRG